MSRELIAGQSAFACLLPGASVEVAESDDKKAGLTKENLARFGSMAASDIMTPPSKRARSWVQLSQALSVVGGSVLGGESPAGKDRGGLAAINLVKVRTEVIAEAKRNMNHIVEKKSSHCKTLGELVGRLRANHSDVKTLGLVAKFTEFELQSAALKLTIETTKKWTQGSVEAEAEKAWSAMNALEALDGDFFRALDALKKVRRQEVCASTTDKRKLRTHMRQVLGKGGVDSPRRAEELWLVVGRDSSEDPDWQPQHQRPHYLERIDDGQDRGEQQLGGHLRPQGFRHRRHREGLARHEERQRGAGHEGQ